MAKKFFSWVFGLNAVILLFGKLTCVYAIIADRAVPDNGRIGFFEAWLVDYSGGYVRRGLCGSVIRWFCETFSLSPEIFLLIVPTLLFVILVMIAFIVLRKRNLAWWPIMLGVCLSGLSNTGKDPLVMLMCVAAYWIEANVRSAGWRYGLLNLLLVFAINVHEFSFFLTVPILALLTLSDEDLRLPRLFRSVVLAPAVIAFVATAVFHGNAQMADEISAAWVPFLSPWWNNVPLRGIGYWVGCDSASLCASTVKNMSQCVCGVPNAVFFLAEVAAIFIVVARLPFMGGGYARKFSKGLLPMILLIQLIPVAVVFPFFWDYSRLMGYWTMSSMMCYAIIPEARWLKAIEQARGFLRVGRIPGSGLCQAILRIPRRVVLVLALVVGMSCIKFDLRQCIGRSVVGVIVHGCAYDFYKAKCVQDWLVNFVR